MVSCVFVLLLKDTGSSMKRTGIVSALYSVPQVPTTHLSLWGSVQTGGIGMNHTFLLLFVIPICYSLININNCVPILICEYLGSRRQRREISAPQGFPSLMWKAEHTYMKGHKNKYQAIHNTQIYVQRSLTDSNAGNLISKIRDIFPTALLTPFIRLKEQIISNILKAIFTYQK